MGSAMLSIPLRMRFAHWLVKYMHLKNAAHGKEQIIPKPVRMIASRIEVCPRLFCPQDAFALAESPFLMHPVENKRVGLYKTPIAILDFASLYPSLYRAYNLCYTTLLHAEDTAAFPPEQVFTTPTGVL